MLWQVLAVLSFAVATNRGQVMHIPSIPDCLPFAHCRFPQCFDLYDIVQVMSAKKDPEKDAVFKRKSAVRPSGHSFLDRELLGC